MSALEARGRLPGEPVAIVDIGSNSVRLVAYESLSRALTPTFNEKVLCGLGRGVATTGFLTDEAVAKALAALRRFKVLCRTMEISDVRAAGDGGGARRRATARSSWNWRSGRSAARSPCWPGRARRSWPRSASSPRSTRPTAWSATWAAARSN